MDLKACAASDFYTVRAGDSVASIAVSHGVLPGALMAYNPYVDPATLRVGEVLCLPPRERTVFVRYGQTLADLLTRYNISYRAFMEANHYIGEAVAPGMRCRIPARGARGSAAVDRYVLTEGDDAASVARKFGLTMLDLLRLNPAMTPEDFTPGRAVRIRGDADASE